MAKQIAFHSFRRGTGCTSVMASAAAIKAQAGKRIGIVDANLQSPGAHILFSLSGHDISHTLNDFLLGECAIEDAIYAVGNSVSVPKGQVYLLPASDNVATNMRILKNDLDIGLLTEAYTQFSSKYNLDYLFIDTGSGLNEIVLASLTVTDATLTIMRLDEQAYQGAAITLSMIKNIPALKIMIVANDVPAFYNLREIQATLAEKFGTEVNAVLPHAEQFLTLGSKDIFMMRHPQHPFTETLRGMVDQL